MKCYNCGSEHWENVDQYRFKQHNEDGSPKGMNICLDCGAISYPAKWQTKEAILAHYRTDYRKPPTVFNAFSGQRKNHFHAKMLKPVFEKWQKEGKTKPVVLEIGAAYGMTLHFIKQNFPEAEIHGTELTKSMVRNAWHEFGISLKEDFDDTKKYDLIISYKVIEHQLDPHLEMARYSKCLADDGVLYISVPTWFNVLSNFGMDGFDLEYYYDPNHINVWTKEMFESILQRSGFEITGRDHVMYGDSYLCKASDLHKNDAVLKLNPDDVKKKMELVKQASNAFVEQDYERAIAAWPNFPAAQISGNEMKRKLLAENGWEWFKLNIINKSIAECPESVECIIMATDFALRARKYNEAIAYANKGLDMKPHNPGSVSQLINIFEQIAIHSKTEEEKIENFKKAKLTALHLMNTSMQNVNDAISKIYFLNSLIPEDAG